jgi:amino acid adenylation domain-containing protein
MMNKLILNYLKTACQTKLDACAVIFQGEHYSYKALDQWSDRIALRLEEQGINPGERVGLYLDKSIHALACIYGVLKTGACYVPMSPADPASRTVYMLNNCCASLILVSAPIKPDLDSALKIANIAKIDMSNLLAEEWNSTQEFIIRPISSEDAAAVLHTSGSTGEPKGAVITHGNLAVFLNWAVAAFDIRSSDVLLSHAPLQFDLSFFDLFSAVAVGATVVLAESDDTANAARIARLVNEAGVTIWQSVPSALSLQSVSGRGEQMPTVRQVLFAGEPMPMQTLLKLPELFPKARLHNIYGCTETNDTFMYSLPENILEAPDPLPIGHALPHIRYRIVDESDRDVVMGKQGHLLVSGDTLMAGYLGINVRHGIVDGYYRTNDLVSETENGLLQFHGRIDSVVKTNGYRVNLTEIEYYLQHSGKFKEVAVFCVKDDLIGQRIVAAIRPSANWQCSTLDLKIYCARGLPKYAIPHSFYITESEFPKGNTGKIDRWRISYLWQQEHFSKKTIQQRENDYELS